MNYGNIVVQSIVLMFELLQHDEARGLTVWQNVNPPPLHRSGHHADSKFNLWSPKFKVYTLVITTDLAKHNARTDGRMDGWSNHVLTVILTFL